MTRGIDKLQLGAFAFLGAVTITSVLAAFGTGTYAFVLIPFALIIMYTAVIDFSILYFVLLASITFSIEYYFSSSLATDLPDEPLMVGLMAVTLVFVLTNTKALPRGFFSHTLMLFLLAHLFWIFISALASTNVLVSIKVFTAKLWYVSAFCVLTAIIVRTRQDIKKAFWCIFIPLTLLIAQVIVRHAMQGFSFEEINTPMYPFFRNHVNYAAIITIFLPFIWLVRQWYPKGSMLRRLLSFAILFYLLAIYLSYTRTCYLAVMLIIPFALIIKWRMMKPALVAIAIGGALLVGYLFHQNKFLDYAPIYSETIIHDEFGQHLSSTFEGKDVSGMERVYRWVAITQMWDKHPWFGFGPGNFYPNYKDYTLSSFETYVSDNPERSTAHNYFLLLLAEQGLTGLIIFLILSGAIFVLAENIYHRMKSDEDRTIIMALAIMMVLIYVNLMLSDMLETDKVGPFFFMAIAIMVSLDIKNKRLVNPDI